jgi:hypothetical protein
MASVQRTSCTLEWLAKAIGSQPGSRTRRPGKSRRRGRRSCPLPATRCSGLRPAPVGDPTPPRDGLPPGVSE